MLYSRRLADLLDLQLFFRRCCTLQKKYPKKFRLDFVLINAERAQQDLVGGIKDVKIFKNRIQFVGKAVNVPKVVIDFNDIKSIKMGQSWGMHPDDSRDLLIVTAVPQIHYRIPPGPDL